MKEQFGSDGKGSICNAADPGSIPGLGRSPEEEYALQHSCVINGEFHGQRSLVGHSPWGCKELDVAFFSFFFPLVFFPIPL